MKIIYLPNKQIFYIEKKVILNLDMKKEKQENIFHTLSSDRIQYALRYYPSQEAGPEEIAFLEEYIKQEAIKNNLLWRLKMATERHSRY